MNWAHISPPWDQRLARLLVRPLARTSLSPNHVTTLSLLAGLGSGVLYGLGGELGFWGAVMLALAIFIDHADGELARLTGRTSEFGHYYDNVVGGVILVAAFIGMGIGLRGGDFGTWSIAFGISAGISSAIVFGIRLDAGRSDSLVQPSFAGFEIEDVLYLIVPITWLGWLETFLALAGIGTPIYLAFQIWQLRRNGVHALKRGISP